MASLIDEGDSHVGKEIGLIGIACNRDLMVVHRGLEVAHALEHNAKIAMQPDTIGPQSQRQLVLFPCERKELPVVEGGTQPVLTDRAPGIGFHRVAPQRLRVSPYLYLV